MIDISITPAGVQIVDEAPGMKDGIYEKNHPLWSTFLEVVSREYREVKEIQEKSLIRVDILKNQVQYSFR